MSLTPQLREKVCAAVDCRIDALLQLCCDLIAFPTVNPPGEAYWPCAEFIGRRLRSAGYDVSYIRGHGEIGDSDRYPRTNVIGRYGFVRPGPTVHFNGHIDVVPAGQGWTKEPFRAAIEDGRVYGRGACDMKGGLASAMIAAEVLIQSGLPLCGAVEISGTVDEESGGQAGVACLARQGLLARPRVDHVIIPEPLNVDRICIGHRGVWWAEVETQGRIAHGSMPFLGDCAVRHMGAFLQAIEQDLMPRLAARRTTMPVVPEAARASTLNINALHGGMDEREEGLMSPCVPDSCRITLDRRFLVEESCEDVRAEIIDLLDGLAQSRPGFAYRVRDLMTVMPVLVDRNQPVPQSLLGAIEAVLGREASFVCSPGTYDQKHFARLGHIEDCVAYGPGILDLAHQPDEYVLVQDLIDSARIMALAAVELLLPADA